MNIELQMDYDPFKKPRSGIIPYLVFGENKLPLLSMRNLPLRYATIEKCILDLIKRYPEQHLEFTVDISISNSNISRSVKGNLLVA